MFKELKPASLLNPVPVVMVSCKGKEQNDAPNIITAAWAGTVCSQPPMVSISIRKSRYSHDLIIDSGEFAVNLVDKKLAKACDFCGVKSGRDTDKFKACGLDATTLSEMSYAPGIAQSPLILGCKVKQVIELGSHDMIIGEVKSIKADEALFDENDRLCLDKAQLIAYNHGEYFALGEKLGFFGWSVASDKVISKRRAESRAEQSGGKEGSGNRGGNKNSGGKNRKNGYNKNRRRV